VTGGDYPDPESYSVGSEVAGYRLEEQIGRGGMALVYRARDVQLGRNVALKLLSPVLGRDEAFRQRFIRESRAAAAVDHPHIIPIFAAGDSDGVLFIAMRYVQGGDVRRLVDELGTLPAERAVSIITQVASALDAAHLNGLVHRDIKPANMLLDSTDGAGQRDHVYLADFGLSKRSLSATGLTSIGQFLGTPAYVAPEQIEGRTVDGRADLYALACASYEMLSGVPPFQRDDDLAIMWAQVSAPPPSLTEQRPDLPPAADTVLQQALAKDPAERFPTCLAFAAALRTALELPGPAAGSSAAGAGRTPTVLSGPSASRPPGPPAPSAPSAPPPARDYSPTQTSGPRQVPDHPPTQVSGPRDVPAHPPTQVSGPRPGAPSRPVDPPTADWQPAEPLPPARDRGPAGPGPAGPGPAGPGPGGPSGPSGSTRPAGRRRRRWPAAAAGLVVVAGAIGAFAALHGGGGHGDRATGAADTAPARTPAAALPAITAPGCRSGVAKATSLSTVRTQSVAVGAHPFGVSTTSDGKFTFVTRLGAIVVLANGSGLTQTVEHVITVPGLQKAATLTHNGKYLVAALNSGAVVIDTAAAEQGSSHAIVGTLTGSSGSGGVEVGISPDDKFVFVTLQESAAMAVFNLQTALTHGFGPSAVVGQVPLNQQPVGLTFSPDAKLMYVTSMMKAPGQAQGEGTVSVIDTATAETDPAKAVKSSADAGCDPVRAITDGTTVWVTSRESNALLGFSASRLLSDPRHALETQVNVGSAPIGETFAGTGGRTRILIADSNQGGSSSVAPTVAVVDPAKALRRQQALLGYVGTGQLPRQFTVQPGGKTALVTNDLAGRVQAIDLTTLP
jgi:serine/threonine protein kinase/DNA-binding beta-propeller fold protein YncE